MDETSSHLIRREQLLRRTTFHDYVERQLAPIMPRGAALATPQAAELHQRLQELEEEVRAELQPGDELWEWSSTGNEPAWGDLDKPTASSGLAILRGDKVVRSWVILTG